MESNQPGGVRSFMGAIGCAGLFWFVIILSCAGIFGKEALDTQNKLNTKIEMMNGFLEPSNGRMLIVSSYPEVVLNNKGHRGPIKLVCIIQCNKTGRRKSLVTDLNGDNLPITGETWLVKVDREGDLVLIEKVTVN